MQSEQIQIHLTDFRINLQHKLTRNVSVGCLIFFGLFIILKIAGTMTELKMRTMSQFDFMVMIGKQMTEGRSMEIDRVMNFLDGCEKIMEAGGYSSGTYSCNANYFDCSLSSASNYSTYQAIYPILKVNSRSLVSNIHSTFIFLYKDNEVVYLNSTPISLPFNITINNQLVNQLTTTYSSNTSTNIALLQKYIIAEVPSTSGNLYQFYCLYMNPISSVLCVTLVKQYSDSVLASLDNNFFFQSDLPQLTSTVSSPSIMEWATQVSTLDYYFLQNCLSDYITKISIYVDAGLGIPTTCGEKPIIFLGLFTGSFVYSYFHHQISPEIQPISYSIPLKSNPYTLSYYISANSTYYADIDQIKSRSLNQIRYTGYSLVAVIAVSLFFLTISVDTIENTLLTSIMLIRNMSEHLRNKEQKQFNSFTKKPELFSFLVDYFHKFMWIHKLLKFKNKSRYKRLLKEGIDLFGHQNSAVQEYIFRELIAIQGILVQKYLKMKELPLRRKSTKKTRLMTFSNNKFKQFKDQTKQRMPNKRRNANYNLLNPDNEELMKNISVSFRQNRGVRFSNDIQTLQIDEGPILRKSKSSQIYGQTCKTIQNQLSESNIDIANMTEPKDESKSEKSYEDSEFSLNGLSRSKKDSSIIRGRGFESVHFDLNNLRLDEEFSDEEDDLTKETTQEEQIYQMSPTAITEETAQAYRRIIAYYQDLIALKSQSLTESNLDILTQQIAAIYELTLQKYWWWTQLLTFQNNMNIIKQEDQRQELAQFQDLIHLEQKYMHLIRHEQVQRGQIARLMVHQCLQLPVPFKTLEYLGKSSQKEVRITARYLIATMAEQLSPHLDQVLFNNLIHPLIKQQSSNIFKRKLLTSLIRILQTERHSLLFEDEVPQLKLVKQFYNTSNKKIYFLSSLPNPKPYHKLLNKLFDLIHPFDLLLMFNLDEDQFQQHGQEISEANINRVRLRRSNNDRIKFLLDNDDFINIFNFNDRVKDFNHSQRANSSKTINKKRVYEKQFHEILNFIENDQTQFSKYIIVLLGDEQGVYVGQGEESSSTGNNRPYQQKIHQEITKIIDKGYHHYIMAGHQLSAYPSKYGRLKKYLKLAPDLLEVDLSDKDQEENYRQLEKYLK